jgi:hypothetical protein
MLLDAAQGRLHRFPGNPPSWKAATTILSAPPAGDADAGCTRLGKIAGIRTHPGSHAMFDGTLSFPIFVAPVLNCRQLISLLDEWALWN